MGFSVVIPLHNKETTVLRAVESVLRQTELPESVIVVDDGSTDNSVSRLMQSEFWKFITLIRQAQSGPGPARNAGWSRSGSEWIAFLDADDVWLPRHLATLRVLVEELPDVEWVSTSSKVVMERSSRRPAEYTYVRSAVNAIMQPTRRRRASYFDLNRNRFALPNSSTTAVQKQALEAVAGFPHVVPNEDLALWCALALRGCVGYSPVRTVEIHRGTSNISTYFRQRDSSLYCEDAFALAETPHFRVVSTALDHDKLDSHIRVSAELYLDYLLLRHWPTVIVQKTQTCAREALSLVRRKRHWRYALFIFAAYLPQRTATLLSALGNQFLRFLRVQVPVSPFVRRQLD